MTSRSILTALAVAVAMIAILPAVAIAQDEMDEDGLLIRIGGDASVAANERIAFVAIVSGELVVEGEVSGFLAVADGDAHILDGGVVSGDVAVFDGVLTLRDGSRVEGDILLSDNAELVIETGADHRGEVREEALEWGPGREFAINTAVFYISYWLVLTLCVLLLAAAFAGIGGRQLTRVASDLTERFVGTLLTTLALAIFVVLAACALIISIFGIPVVMLLVLGGTVAWYLGLIVAGTRLGAFVLRRPLGTDGGDRPYVQALVGTLLLHIVVFAAGAGWLFLIVFGLIAGDAAWLGFLVGIPSFVIGVLVWVIGVLGLGAMAYRAILVWTRRDEPVQPGPSAV